jgi:hypothetical protein
MEIGSQKGRTVIFCANELTLKGPSLKPARDGSEAAVCVRIYVKKLNLWEKI